MDLILAARLPPGDLFEILRGVYVEYLEKMDVSHRLVGILSTEDIAWLLDDGNPTRFSSTFAER